MSVLLFLLIFPALRASHQNILLSHGEHREINVIGMSHFTNGNKDVVLHNHDPEKGTLLLKGQKLGFSEIIIWRGEKMESWRVYVVSKRQHLKLFQLLQNFEAMGLKAKIEGMSLKVSGVISQIGDYQRVHELKEKNSQLLDLNLTLGHELRKQIKTRVLRVFFDHYIDDIQCHTYQIQIECVYPQDQNLKNEDLSFFKDQWKIQFRQSLGSAAYTNYRIRLKLIQFEQTDGREMSLGLDGLNMSWGDLFGKNFSSIIDNNRILLQDKQVQVSTLAEPETLLKLDAQAKLRIGSEIPYAQTGQTGIVQTDWKFAGLEIDIVLKRHGPHFALEYRTGFTRPDQNSSVTGNTESSTVILDLGQPLVLFKINFQTIGQRENHLPFLREIPLLGKLFSSSSNESTYKNLTGVIQLEKVQL